MERAWTIREYREGDEKDILKLFEAIYGEVADKELWMRWWKWQFRDAPAGQARIWLADHNGEIVGHYALIRADMKVGSEIITASQNVGTMTHPAYRRQGIYSALEKRALSEEGNRGTHITFGFPNEAAYPGHIKRGFLDIGVIRAMLKPLNLENIVGRYVRNKLLSKVLAAISNIAFNLLYLAHKPPKIDGIQITKVSFFDERINDLWERIYRDYDIIVVRNKEYLNWRFVDVPGVDYTIYLAEKESQILGYTVLKCERQFGLKVGRIFELIVPLGQQAVVQLLALKAVEVFREEKADFVLYRIIGNKAHCKAVSRCGFMSSQLIGRGARFIARTNTPKISEKFLKERRHWFVQTGDSDAN